MQIFKLLAIIIYLANFLSLNLLSVTGLVKIIFSYYDYESEIEERITITK